MARDKNGLQMHPQQISKMQSITNYKPYTRRLGMDSCIEHGESSLPAKAGLITTASAVVDLTIWGLPMTTPDSVFFNAASKRSGRKWTQSMRI